MPKDPRKEQKTNSISTPALQPLGLCPGSNFTVFAFMPFLFNNRAAFIAMVGEFIVITRRFILSPYMLG